MPKRNRAQEIKRHGQLAEGFRIPDQKPAEVTDQDKQNLGALAVWAQRYVNNMYEHGGYQGRPLKKRYNDSIRWQYGLFGILRDCLTTSVSARHDLEWVGSFDPGHEEYIRQMKHGLDLEVATEVKTEMHAHRSDCESLRLTLDVDGHITAGSYHWVGAQEVNRPAPNAVFGSLDEAHRATISGRAAHLLGRFRELVLDDNSDFHMHGVSPSMSFVPPLELQAIPEFSA